MYVYYLLRNIKIRYASLICMYVCSSDIIDNILLYSNYVSVIFSSPFDRKLILIEKESIVVE